MEASWEKGGVASKSVDTSPAQEPVEITAVYENPADPSVLDDLPVAAESMLMPEDSDDFDFQTSPEFVCAPDENTIEEVQNSASKPSFDEKATVEPAKEEIAPEAQNTTSELVCDKSPIERPALALVPKPSVDKTNPTAIWVQIKKDLKVSNQLSTQYAVYLMKRGNTFAAMDQLAAEDATFGQAYYSVMAS